MVLNRVSFDWECDIAYENYEVDVSKGRRVRVACAECGSETHHEVRCSFNHTWGNEDIQGMDSHQVVQCMGCDSTSFRSVSSSSEDIDYGYDGELVHPEHVEVYPPRAAGRRKLPGSSLLPYQVEYIYNETHKALCSEMRVLAAIGIRALVEAVCAEEQAEGRTLEKKIDDLVSKGVLTKVNADILHRVRYMGIDAAHEIKRHNLATLGTAFEVAENLLQNVYILPEKAERLEDKRRKGPRGT